MTLPIVWRSKARQDLLDLYDWIARHAGADVAIGYTAAIEHYRAKLGDYPGWGSPRDDLAAGIRTIAYQRKTTIAYVERDNRIEIVRIGHGGRGLGAMFADDDA